MLVSMTSAMPQKMRGILFLFLGCVLFTLVLVHTAMLGHLVALLGVTVADASLIVNAIISGTIASLPAQLQASANAFSALVQLLLPSLGVAEVVAL